LPQPFYGWKNDRRDGASQWIAIATLMFHMQLVQETVSSASFQTLVKLATHAISVVSKLWPDGRPNVNDAGEDFVGIVFMHMGVNITTI